VFDDTCLSKLRYYGRSIVVEALDDICSFSEVGRCLIDLFFLCLEEKVLLVCCVFCSGVETAYSNFEVPLPFSSFEEPLAYLITFPEFVRRMSLLRSYVTTALLFVLLVMFFFTMFLNAAWRSTDVLASLALYIDTYALQAIEIDRQCIQGCLARLRVFYLGFDKSDVAKTVVSFSYIIPFLSGKTTVLLSQMFFHLGRNYGDLAFVTDNNVVLRINCK
jgi:hypothetical protein